MRGRLPLVLGSLVLLAAPAGVLAEDAPPHRPWSTVPPGPYAILPGVALNLTLEDGETLSYGLHMPDVPAGTRVPVLLTAGPYFDLAEEPVTLPSTSRLSGFLIENFVPHGYAVVAASIRGTGWSGGCMEFMSRREARDLDELVTRLAGETWSSGAVGMIGKSYDGATPWMAAQFANPALKTIVPIAGIPDAGDLSVHHGVAQFRTPLMGNAQYWSYGFGTDLGLSESGRPLDKRVRNLACPEMLENVASAPYSAVTGDLEANPVAAAYWEERNFARLAKPFYQGSVFIVHGLQDFNVNPHLNVPLFNELPQEKKMWLGQWAHHYPDEGQFTNRPDFAATLLRWFDRHLKGADVDTGPVVEVADGRTGAWRSLPAWPMTPAAERAFVLEANRVMGAGSSTPFAETIVTPAGAYFENPCLGGASPLHLPVLGGSVAPIRGANWRSAPVAAGFRVSGVPVAEVTLDPATNGNLMAVVCDGTRIIAHGATGLLYAGATNEPQPYVPGLPLTVRIEMEPVEYSVAAGSRLALHLRAEGWLADPEDGYYWPGTGAVMRVTGGSLTLPVH